jgi:hypothetical protein
MARSRKVQGGRCFRHPGGVRRSSGKRLWDFATDPATHERTDIGCPQRRRRQDIR